VRLFPRRPAAQPQGVAAVETWGVEPIGANQVESLLARRGALLAGFTAPNPAGWGLAGSVEATDQHIWASPQAFNAGAGRQALSVWAVGSVAPIAYPQDAHTAQVVLPGPGGV